MKTFLTGLVIVAVVVVGYMVLKPKDSGEPTASMTPSPTRTVTATPVGRVSSTPIPSVSGGANPTPKTHQVVIKNMTFTTATLTVKKGDKVTFSNQDSTAHTATADNGAFNSGTISAGGNWTLNTTNLAVGTYEYDCGFHPSMQAKIVVQ